MSKPIIFVDFDRTLFDLDKYLDWLADFLSERFGVEHANFREEYYSSHAVNDEGEQGVFLHIKHFEEKMGLNWEFVSGEIERAVIEQKVDFLYPGAKDFLQKCIDSFGDVRILTYAHESYQRFKLGLCPFVSTYIPTYCTELKKRDFILNNLPSTRGVLVDDKAPHNLPEGWKNIWLAGGKHQAKPGDYDAMANSFEEAYVQLTEIVDTMNG